MSTSDASLSKWTCFLFVHPPFIILFIRNFVCELFCLSTVRSCLSVRPWFLFFFVCAPFVVMLVRDLFIHLFAIPLFNCPPFVVSLVYANYTIHFWSFLSIIVCLKMDVQEVNMPDLPNANGYQTCPFGQRCV